jgi:RHS repeat-associated protein
MFVYDAFEELAAECSTVGSPSGGTQHLMVDQMGGTRRLTMASRVMERHDRQPFGDELIPTAGDWRLTNGLTGFAWSSTVRQMIAGGELDAETGLDYFGARCFSSAQGRFTSPDPMMASAKVSNPQSWNRYTYGFNNPLRFTDPTGMYTCAGTKDRCKEFEKSRAAILKSNNSDAVRAANAYGKANLNFGPCGGRSGRSGKVAAEERCYASAEGMTRRPKGGPTRATGAKARISSRS